MPMDFPNSSLERTGKIWKFRERKEGETVEEYRLELHNHVLPKDRIEAFEIKFGIGWDQWSEDQMKESLGF